ncbi:WYL domain-containing protein [Paenibacillus nanensis]|uniref:WYL domain-containing protein n=2 Tax=Paenibacillus nanensis TaxID=393251 RepID=A0A3A1UZR6_9BACL|nr:WYL domain-containing protein [Paenibacillus nanensis]
MAILIALQHRSETAQALAEKLEVSKRTILRDMQALSEIGIPLYAVPGPSGGFRLMDGYKLPPLHFDAKEAFAILFALDAVTKLTDTPFHQARWTVADKIRACLPQSVLQQVEPMLEHIEIDIPDRPQRTPLLNQLLDHAASSRWIRAYYRSERKQRWITIKPIKVYTAHGFWYCEAYSPEHRENRTFRADRFTQIEHAAKPDEAILQQVAGETGHAAADIPVVARLSYRGALLAEQDPHVGHQVRQIDDEEWELAFTCPSSEWNWAIKFFYALGTDAMVLEPLELRDELYKQGLSLTERYASKPSETRITGG